MLDLEGLVRDLKDDIMGQFKLNYIHEE